MKKFFRPVTALCIAAMLVSCTSPYQAQMAALHNEYQAGNISEREYRREMSRLQVNDAGWQQQNANNTNAVLAGAAVVGAAAIIANNNDHHHHHRYHRPYRYRRW